MRICVSLFSSGPSAMPRPTMQARNVSAHPTRRCDSLAVRRIWFESVVDVTGGVELLVAC